MPKNLYRQHRVSSICLSVVAILLPVTGASAAEPISYQQQIAPILTKYCAGCHNDSDLSGDFSLTSPDALRKGTPDGPVLVAGSPQTSLLWQLLVGEGDSKMPPEKEAQPTESEMEWIRAWIEQGILYDDTPISGYRLNVPRLTPAASQHHYVSSAAAMGETLVLGKLGRVEALRLFDGQPLNWATDGFSGKINSLRATDDGRQFIVGTGIVGLGGEIGIIDSETGKVTAKLTGHSDAVYCAALSPDGKWLASGSYDRKVLLWDMSTRAVVREFTGHNGAIYDLDFDPSSSLLATASADQTVKLWNLESGQRLDTLGQPEGEMLCVRFSSDGKSVFAAGTDRQIRKWALVSREEPAINPMLVARYAHESDILRLEWFGRDHIVSASSDGTAKLWLANQLEPRGEIARFGDTPVALCVLSHGDVACITIELDGTRQDVSRKVVRRLTRQKPQHDPWPNAEPITNSSTLTESAVPATSEEAEPNDSVAEANRVALPAELNGRIQASDDTRRREDVDVYEFSAQAGQTWLIEIHAADHQSGLDSFVDILDSDGRPVVQTRMQAVRESYFTFRGKDSSTSDDFRLHKWEDMELDQFLYSAGEITQLWLYPRGPDSGFKVYPGFGDRFTFFGTTPISHALGEPAYIVRELLPGEEALPNGLPVFPIYFENDDDGLRRAGKDSRLTFIAPHSGAYYLRVRDVRGFSGENFGYRAVIRRPQPDFKIAVSNTKLSMPRGSGREWKVSATRIDGLTAPISITIEGLPDGFLATNPLIIEAGQETALGTIFATQETAIDGQPAGSAESAAADDEKNGNARPSIHLRLTARSEWEGREIVHELEDTLELSLNEMKEVQFQLFAANDDSRELEQLTIRPGETISAKVVVQRNGTESRIGFGKEDSGRNLPHGAFVDNIGLNGLLITEQQNEREFFITAAPKVQPGRRQFHLRSDTRGNPTSRPIWLEVIQR